MREQVNFKGTEEEIKDFMRFLIDNSESAHVDILDCSISWARQTIDMPFEEVLDMIKNSSMASIQINREPMFKMRDYEKWEGGFIEGFLRTMTTPDYFIWTYHKMSELNNILNYINNGSTKRNYN